MNALGSLGFNQLQGIVESDETFFRESMKGRVRAEEIDIVIGEYIHPSALRCTDTATNYKKFAKNKRITTRNGQ